MFSYNAALQFLSGLQPSRIQLGLEVVERMCSMVGHPERRVRYIHLAGTNGKGSVAACVDSILRAHGLRVGLYTSPHLVELRERIQVQGEMVGKEVFASEVERMRAVVGDLQKEGVQPSYFDVLTVLAFLIFEKAKLDFGILETGMGGRLDSTNVVMPTVCGITGIGLDHEKFLGDTVEAIAREKAGIFKSDVAAWIAECSPSVRDVLLREGRQRGARVRQLGPVTSDSTTVRGEQFCYSGERFEVALHGEYQARNAALAIELVRELERQGQLSSSDDKLRQGLETVEWPGRFQILREDPPRVLDGAHNVEAFRSTLKTWRRCFSKDPARCLVGWMRDKRVAEMASALDTPGVEIWLVRLQGSRAMPVSEMKDLFKQAKVECWESAQEAWIADTKMPHKEGTLVMGSLYLVGEILSFVRECPHEVSFNG